MKEKDPQSTYAQRLAALDLLRENIFFSEPQKLNASSFIEDLPGGFRASAPLIKNILPSVSIISKDPEERKKQIKDALERIKKTKKSSSALGQEILSNAANLGVKTLPLGFMLSTAFQLLSPRLPYKAHSPLTGGARNQNWRSPISPIATINKVFDRKGYAKRLALNAAKDSLIGAGLGTITGAAYPVFAHHAALPDKPLEEAAKILQEQPYLTSLPTAELLSVVRDSEDSDNKFKSLKNLGLGTAIGAGTGALGALATTAMKGLGYGGLNLYKKLNNQAIEKNILSKLSRGLMRDLNVTVPVGVGLGAVSGLMTKNITDYDQQKNDADKTQSDRVIL